MLRRFVDARLRRERDNYRALTHAFAARLREARAENARLTAELARTQETHR